VYRLFIRKENFELFSQPIPSRSLGFVDSKALELDIAVAGKDFCIRQSPGLLVSNRKEGTTGAGELVQLLRVEELMYTKCFGK
jgi:hypothetical protein